MTTVKVKLRPSTVPGKKHTLYYQLIHRRAVRHITTTLRLHPHEWDPETQTVSPGTEHATLIQNRISEDLYILHQIIREYDYKSTPYTVDRVVERFHQMESRQHILSYLRLQIDKLRSNGQLGTAKNYERAYNSLSRFLGGQDLVLNLFTEPLVNEYNHYLEQRGLVRNSISFYMRILRSVYNKAVRQHLVRQTHPFQNVYTGIDRTRKRAVREQLIAELNDMPIPQGSPEDFARDLFIFSYCTRGMAFVDIAYLRKTNLREGSICYQRHKTQQQLSVKIEPNVQRILNKYRKQTQGSPYVFPILKDQGSEADYRQYRLALNAHNRILRQLSTRLSRPCALSSYTPRHTWATAAQNHNIPISVISAGLGHHSERTTRIYLSLLENSVLDSANQEIIKGLL